MTGVLIVSACVLVLLVPAALLHYWKRQPKNELFDAMFTEEDAR